MLAVSFLISACGSGPVDSQSLGLNSQLELDGLYQLTSIDGESPANDGALMFVIPSQDYVGAQPDCSGATYAWLNQGTAQAVDISFQGNSHCFVDFPADALQIQLANILADGANYELGPDSQIILNSSMGLLVFERVNP